MKISGSFDAAAVYKSVKEEMDESTYKLFEKCVFDMDTNGMELYLRYLTPFKNYPQLLTNSNLCSLLILFFNNKIHENQTTMQNKINAMQLSQMQSIQNC